MNIFIGDIQGNTAILTAEESRHCAKVLRKKINDEVTVIDGKGLFYTGKIEVVNEKRTVVTISGSYEKGEARNYYLHLAIAPTKQIDRIEWMIEKAVEIGVDEISFVQCKNSERTTIKIERINKIVESAVKQSLQAFIPKVNEMIKFKDFIQKNKLDQNLIAHCFTDVKTEIKVLSFKNKKTIVMIGPEGDFTKEEINMAFEKDFRSVSLGPNRLRTETAGLYACQVLSILN